MSLEAQCAAAEREAKRQSAPIFGLEGAAYDCEGGSDVVPGPLVCGTSLMRASQAPWRAPANRSFFAS